MPLYLFLSLTVPDRYNIFKIHWLMAALAFTKSISLLFHSVRTWAQSRVWAGVPGSRKQSEQATPQIAADPGLGSSMCPSILSLWPAVHPLHLSTYLSFCTAMTIYLTNCFTLYPSNYDLSSAAVVVTSHPSVQPLGCDCPFLFQNIFLYYF